MQRKTYLAILLAWLCLCYAQPPSTVEARPLGTDVSGTISEDTTWTAAGNPYVLRSVTVGKDVTLTINEGTIVKFLSSASLSVYGNFEVNGQENNKVIFTSYDDDSYGGDTNENGSETTPTPGDWYQIKVEKTGIAVINHAIIQYGGRRTSYSNLSGFKEYPEPQIEAYESSLELSNSTIAYSYSTGVFARNNTPAPMISNNIFMGNSGSAIIISGLLPGTGGLDGNTGHSNGMNGFRLSGSISEDTIWTANDGLAYIPNDVTIRENQTLTIHPSVVIKPLGDSSITVHGNLAIEGAADNKVVITSYNDDSHGGDTNNNGSDTEPTPGDWYQIKIEKTGKAIINHAIIQYGGQRRSTTLTGGINRHLEPQIEAYESSLELSNSTIAYSYSTGVHAYNNNPAPIISNNVFMRNSNLAVTIYGLLPGIAGLDGNTGSGNGINGFFLNGSISKDTVWTANDGLAYIPSDVTIREDQTLTIAPGVIVKPLSNGSILVNGILSVEGTIDNKVVFTSIHDDSYGGDTNNNGSNTEPTSGQWERIHVEDTGSAIIDHAIVQYGGQSPFSDSGYIPQIDIDEGALILSNSAIADGKSTGVRIRAKNAIPSIINNTFTKNNGYAVSIFGSNGLLPGTGQLDGNSGSGNNINGFRLNGSIREDTVWTANEGLVYAPSSITVRENTTLTIGAGVVVKPIRSGVVTVEGTLSIEGEPDSQVVFTSFSDDSYGGDTNNNASETEPTPGDWQQIKIEDTGHAIINHAVIQYGGKRVSSSVSSPQTFAKPQLEASDGSLILSNSTIANGHSTGLYIYYRNASEPTIIGNSFFDNAFGLSNGSPSREIDARNNYWGDPTGPYHAELNPNGLGNVVSDGVLFDPWLPFPGAIPTEEEIETLAVGTEKTLTIEPMKPYYLKLEPAVGNNLVVSLDVTSGLGQNSIVRLLGSGNRIPLPYAFDKNTETTADNGHTELPISPVLSSEFYLLVYAPFLREGTVNVTLNSQYTDLHISSVSPNRGSDAGNLTVEIKGTGMTDVDEVALIGASGEQLSSNDIFAMSDSTLVATIPLQEQSIGNYALELQRNSDNANARLSNAVEVFAGSAGRVKLQLEGPELVRPGRIYHYRLHYENVGDADMPAPFIATNFDGSTAIMHSEGYTSTTQLVWLAGGDAARGDILSPGEGGVVEFDVSAEQDIIIRAGVVEENDQPFDWSVVELTFARYGFADETWDTAPELLGADQADVLIALRFLHAEDTEAILQDELLMYALRITEAYTFSDSVMSANTNEWYYDRIQNYDVEVAREDVKLYLNGSMSEVTNNNFHSEQSAIFITHGWNDGSDNDTLKQIAESLKEEYPNHNIIRVTWDNGSESPPQCAGAETAGLAAINIKLAVVWSAASVIKEFPPCAKQVSKRTKIVAVVVHEQLRELGYDTKLWNSTLYIGHSFGNAVNAKISQQAPVPGKGLLLNPASASGFAKGAMPDYAESFSDSLAIYTDSVADANKNWFTASKKLWYGDPKCEDKTGKGNGECSNIDLGISRHGAGPHLLRCLLADRTLISDDKNDPNANGCVNIIVDNPTFAKNLIETDWDELGLTENASDLSYRLDSGGNIYVLKEVERWTCDNLVELEKIETTTTVTPVVRPTPTPPCLETSIEWINISQKDDLSVGVVRSRDPNDKIGPIGLGEQRVVDSASTLHYTINFENMATATAPVQELRITDSLDPNLDWTTFQFTSISYGDRVLSIDTGPGVLEYADQDYPPTIVITGTTEGNMRIDIEASVDIQTGQVTWYLKTVDDATEDFPLDALAGFLPPEDGSGRGQGYVTFAIQPKSDIAMNTTIRNKASIVFDTNEAIETNEVSNVVGEAVDLVLVAEAPAQAAGADMVTGDDVSLEFTLINDGPETATAVTWNATLADGLTLVSATASQGSCNGTSCTLDALENGSSAQVTLVVNPTVASQLEVTANITTDVIEINPVDNQASISLPVVAADTPTPTLVPPTATSTATPIPPTPTKVPPAPTTLPATATPEQVDPTGTEDDKNRLYLPLINH